MASDTQRERAPGRVGLRLLPFLALIILVAVGRVPASDPPHWAGAAQTVDCTSNCHVAHNSLGGGLNPETGNFNLCDSCHSSGELPIGSTDVADPSLDKGTSHAFDVAADSGRFGTVLPSDTQRLLRVQEGNLVCSTCHNQHTSDSGYGGRSRVGSADKIAHVSGDGVLTSGGDFTGTTGVWYVIEFAVTGDESTAKFGYSKDNENTWFGCDPTPPDGCVTGGELVCDDCFTTGAPPSPTDGVTFSFSTGSYVDGERWEFFAAWPFLRRTMPLNHAADALVDAGAITTGDMFCRDCHQNWVMTHDDDLVGGGGVRSYDGNMKSHPVGIGLDANTKGYDRSVPLDGHGVAQDTGDDGNPTNDLLLDQFGNVQCLTCHGAHFADSNTQTVDGP
jgi:hypothetical protein